MSYSLTVTEQGVRYVDGIVSIEESRQELNEYRRRQENGHGRATGVLKKLNGILQGLERIYAGEQPDTIGPEYSLTSYAVGYTFTSASYETDDLFMCVWHDPDDDVVYGELRKEGWPDIKVEAPWHDEGDECAVTGMLFREAYQRVLPEQAN